MPRAGFKVIVNAQGLPGGPGRRWRAGLAGLLALAGCTAFHSPAPVPVSAADLPFPPPLEQGLAHAVAADDAMAVAALAGANAEFAVRLVSAAANSHPLHAAAIAAAAAAEQPGLVAALAAAAATANPAAAAEIARRSAAVVPGASIAIAGAVIAALLPDDRLSMATEIQAAVRGAAPLSVDDWALAGSSRR